MKKLIAMLTSISTIGSIMPTIIANVSMQEQQTKLESSEINYSQINNLENLSRNKRAIPNLNIPGIRQINDIWCGPAVAESVLRYFGLTNENLPFSELTGIDQASFQYEFARLMRTDVFVGGSGPQHLVTLLNNVISARDLNNRRFYSSRFLPRSYAHFPRFYNLVRESLNNNTPVILGFSGTLLQEEHENENFSGRNHFIVINRISGTLQNPIYHYMDPDGGVFRTFQNSDIRLLFSLNGGVLISYNQQIDDNDVVEEPLEINNNFAIGNNPSLSLYCNILSKRSTENNNKINCDLKSKLYFSDYSFSNANEIVMPDNAKMLSMGILTKGSPNGNLKAGDIWIGTDKGLYYKYKDANTITNRKMGNINEPVVSISVIDDGGAYIRTASNKLYFNSYTSWDANEITTIFNANNKAETKKIFFIKSIENNNFVFVSTTDGLYILSAEGNVIWQTSNIKIISLISWNNNNFLDSIPNNKVIYILKDNVNNIYTINSIKTKAGVEYKKTLSYLSLKDDIKNIKLVLFGNNENDGFYFITS